MDNFVDKLVDTIKETLQSTTDVEIDKTYPTLEEWLETNTDGKGGKRLTRFRRTKEQVEKGLSVKDAFYEYIRSKRGS